jgi:hypothetical protein
MTRTMRRRKLNPIMKSNFMLRKMPSMNNKQRKRKRKNLNDPRKDQIGNLMI